MPQDRWFYISVSGRTLDEIESSFIEYGISKTYYIVRANDDTGIYVFTTLDIVNSYKRDAVVALMPYQIVAAEKRLRDQIGTLDPIKQAEALALIAKGRNEQFVASTRASKRAQAGMFFVGGDASAAAAGSEGGAAVATPTIPVPSAPPATRLGPLAAFQGTLRL